MALKRFYPTADTYISNIVLNARPDNRSADSNLGANPTLQCLMVTSSYPASPAQLARSLLNFNTQQLSGMVFNTQEIPVSGVQYVLKMMNYVIGDTTPQSFDLDVCAVATPWDEGIGQDNINFIDIGYASWNSASSTQAWTTPGGDYFSANSGTQHFDQGYEDLEVDVTGIVQSWLSGTVQPNGLMVKLSNACENNPNSDYWRKVFYSRETHTVEKIPFLEARWADVRTDNRGNFAYNQPNALYLYNLIRGIPRNASEPVTVRLQDNIMSSSASFQQTFSASRIDTGVYAAPVSVYSNTPASSFSGTWVDIWQDSNGMCLMSGNLFPLILTGSQTDPYNDFVVNAVGLKRFYRNDEMARISVNVRRSNYNTHLILQSGSADMQYREYMENMYFSVLNNDSGETVIPFGTGSLQYTKLAYDKSGNYFNLDMDSFVPGFVYRIIFLIQFNKWESDIVDDGWIFKVI